jgi:hypothetical protein
LNDFDVCSEWHKNDDFDHSSTYNIHVIQIGKITSWLCGIVVACGVMGGEIESRQGIGWFLLM